MIYDIMKIWRKRLTHSLTDLMNDEAVYRTAPATPGLLITSHYSFMTKFHPQVANIGRKVAQLVEGQEQVDTLDSALLGIP